MFRPHWFAPHRGVCAFPVYTAQAPGCSMWSRPCLECGCFQVLHKSADSVAPAFCAFPGLSGSGSQRVGRPLPGCGTPFPSAAPARAGRMPVACVHRSWPLAATLPAADVDHPESQEVFRQTPEACLPCGRGWLLWG